DPLRTGSLRSPIVKIAGFYSPLTCHATVKLVDDFTGDPNLVEFGFELIPQLRNELEFLRRGEPLHFREFLKHHKFLRRGCSIQRWSCATSFLLKSEESNLIEPVAGNRVDCTLYLWSSGDAFLLVA